MEGTRGSWFPKLYPRLWWLYPSNLSFFLLNLLGTMTLPYIKREATIVTKDRSSVGGGRRSQSSASGYSVFCWSHVPASSDKHRSSLHDCFSLAKGCLSGGVLQDLFFKLEQDYRSLRIIKSWVIGSQFMGHGLWDRFRLNETGKEHDLNSGRIV
jgi:hypothetical protein